MQTRSPQNRHGISPALRDQPWVWKALSIAIGALLGAALTIVLLLLR